MRFKTFSGFNLIEMIFVVLILAFLASSAFVSTNNILIKSKDVQKIDEIKTIQSALDLYKANEGFYPATSSIIFGQPLVSLDNTRTYLRKIPGLMTDGSKDKYYYYQMQQGASYQIDYEIEKKTGNILPGKCSATPSAICKIAVQ